MRCPLLLKVLSEKLLKRIRVPLVNAQGLLSLAAVILQHEEGLRAARIAHRQARKLLHTFTLDERLDLRIFPQLSGAYNYLRIRIKRFGCIVGILLTTRSAAIHKLAKLELFEFIA